MISLATIEDVLRSEDIEGLLALGAPADEYAFEARTILSLLSESNPVDLSETAVMSAVQKTWSESFGPFSDRDIQKRMPAFENVARQIVTRAQTLSRV